MKHPEWKVILGGREAILRLDLNTLAAFEAETGIDITRIPTHQLRVRDFLTLFRLCLKESLPEATDEQLARWLLPSHFVELVNCLSFLLGNRTPMAPLWASDGEAVAKAISAVLPVLVDVSPGNLWLAQWYVERQMPALVYSPGLEPPDPRIQTYDAIEKLLENAKEVRAWWTSCPAIVPNLEVLKKSIEEGFSAWSCDVPALEGYQEERVRIYGTGRTLIRSFS